MKTDARVKYTRMVIRNTFLELLKEKPVSKITVKEICERSEINRSTFYKHYQDPFDLMEKLEEEILEHIQTTLSQRTYTDVSALYIDMLNMLKENEDLYRILTSIHGDRSLYSRFL